MGFKKITIFFIIFLQVNISVFAQSKLTIQEALKIAIENNYDVKILKINKNIAQAGNDFSFTGGQPIVSANGNLINEYADLRQEYTRSASNYYGNFIDQITLSANVTGSIILFNGYKISATKLKLKEIEAQSIENFKAQIQQTIADVSEKYFEIIHLQEHLKTVHSLIELNVKKLNIIKEKNRIGLGNQTDILQAQIDYNYSIQNKQSQEIEIKQLKVDLLKLMGNKNLETLNNIEDSIVLDRNIIIDSILEKLEKSPSIRSSKYLVKINELVEKETIAQAYPTVKFNVGYNVANISSKAGNTLLNEAFGPFVGLNVAIPIFAGNLVKKQYKITKLNTEFYKLNYDKHLLELKAIIYKLFYNYKDNLKQIDIEKQNILLSKELLNTIIDKYKLGESTIIELQQAQQNFANSSYRLSNLQYLTYVLITELKKIAGELSL